MPMDGDVCADLQCIQHPLGGILGGCAEVEVLAEAVRDFGFFVERREKVVVEKLDVHIAFKRLR